ncbi:hypothetical protein [Methylobacterium radiotolerans]|uniref:hypothetical protein n=1 Tax=Methylobacterium radiotolerans TaxID=31998 RepID=UPI0011BE2425|nr:hypothetical protein [Methylobacterium radiotolerans]
MLKKIVPVALFVAIVWVLGSLAAELWKFGFSKIPGSPFACTLSGFVTGILSALLWIDSARIEGDKTSNAAAAGLSAATVLFNFGCITLPVEFNGALSSLFHEVLKLYYWSGFILIFATYGFVRQIRREILAQEAWYKAQQAKNATRNTFGATVLGWDFTIRRRR